MLELREVSKSYGGQPVLDRVSMAVAANEVTGLLGPSGCGKSTILKMFAGLVRPDSGTVYRQSRRLGFVFQEHRLIPWKTAAENVCFSLRAAGIARKEALRRAQRILERVELAACSSQYPAHTPSELTGLAGSAWQITAGGQLEKVALPTQANPEMR